MKVKKTEDIKGITVATEIEMNTMGMKIEVKYINVQVNTGIRNGEFEL